MRLQIVQTVTIDDGMTAVEVVAIREKLDALAWRTHGVLGVATRLVVDIGDPRQQALLHETVGEV